MASKGVFFFLFLEKADKMYNGILIKTKNNGTYRMYIVDYCQEIINECVRLLCGAYCIVASNVSRTILFVNIYYTNIYSSFDSYSVHISNKNVQKNIFKKWIRNQIIIQLLIINVLENSKQL